MSLEEVVKEAGVSEDSVIGFFRAGRLEDELTYPGHIILTKEELLFVDDASGEVSFKALLEDVSDVRDFFGIVLISANPSGEEAGFLQKIFSTWSCKFKIPEADEFIKKLKKEIKKVVE